MPKRWWRGQSRRITFQMARPNCKRSTQSRSRRFGALQPPFPRQRHGQDQRRRKRLRLHLHLLVRRVLACKIRAYCRGKDTTISFVCRIMSSKSRRRSKEELLLAVTLTPGLAVVSWRQNQEKCVARNEKSGHSALLRDLSSTTFEGT